MPSVVYNYVSISEIQPSMQLLVPHIVLFSVLVTTKSRQALPMFLYLCCHIWGSGLSILTPLSPTLLFFELFAIYHMKLKSHTLNKQVCIKDFFAWPLIASSWTLLRSFQITVFYPNSLYCFRLRHSNWQCPIIWELSGFKYKVASSFFEGYFGGKALNLVFCDMCHWMWLPLVWEQSGS